MSGPYSATYDFISPSIGWALVLDYSSFATSLRIFRTTDGASHWTMQYTGQAEGGQAYIHFFDRDHGFAYAGILYRTVDAGVHWEQVQAPGQFFTFASPTLGWSFGFQEHVYATGDGGITWRQLAEIPPPAFLDPNGELPTESSQRRTSGIPAKGGSGPASPIPLLSM